MSGGQIGGDGWLALINYRPLKMATFILTLTVLINYSPNKLKG